MRFLWYAELPRLRWALSGKPKARLITLTNNSVTDTYNLPGTDNLPDNSVISLQITEFSEGNVIARFKCKLLANQIAFTNYKSTMYNN
jgi:hypothetical protein